MVVGTGVSQSDEGISTIAVVTGWGTSYILMQVGRLFCVPDIIVEAFFHNYHHYYNFYNDHYYLRLEKNMKR